MRILCPMTYFRPYVSGPIVYIENLAGELVRRGHQFTVLTSRHDSSLPLEESWRGVQVRRVPVLRRLSKGVLMPAFLTEAWQSLPGQDVILIQAPQLEAGALAWLARGRGLPVVITYHCDIHLPPGLWNRMPEAAVRLSALAAARAAHYVLAYTADYAAHSSVLRRCPEKIRVIPPPVSIPEPAAGEALALRRQHGLEGKAVIGICGRLSAEKGFEHLMAALPLIARDFPEAHVLHAGPTAEVAGEEAYLRRLGPLLKTCGARWISLGSLTRTSLAAFYAACDVTVLPSTNSMESFGLVQVESMLCGTPVVASDLPGVRVPIHTTGMGELAPPGDVPAIARGILRVLSAPEKYRVPRARIAAEFSVQRSADEYEDLFSLISRRSASPPG